MPPSRSARPCRWVRTRPSTSSDDALHGSCAVATSKVLAAALGTLSADLIVCGAESTDGRVQVMPHMLAERLGIAALTGARKLTVDGSQLTAERQTDEGYEVVTAATPGGGQRLGHDQRAAVPVVQGHHGREEEAGADPVAGRPGHRGGRGRLRRRDVGGGRVREAAAASAGVKVTDEGTGGAQLVEYLATEKFV